ncbi:MAG TPA: HD domain-containing protein, partial [Longimicrobiales bacterium]|nr:HD domain-containing protein [Longimicrobiales bacterium]
MVDSRSFQRLRYIRQLGLAHLVYPGASHTRFDHALGVHHLAKRAIDLLRSHRSFSSIDADDVRVIPYAALLHDIGHYPFSHALEELEQERVPEDHEALVGHFLSDDDVRSSLADVSTNAIKQIEQLVRAQSKNPLQGLVSGSLDLDKIDYLKRDAYFCGVPYGEVDVDRLLHSLTIVEDPTNGKLEIGVHEKGVASLESLLFAKYQMFRNVYWHHAVRAATVMYKRIVSDALDSGIVTIEELIGQTDEGFLHLIESRQSNERIQRLRDRVLPKRALELIPAELDEGFEIADWVSADSSTKAEVEDQLAQEIGVTSGDVYIDYPEKRAMFSLDLLVERRNGEVIRLGPEGHTGLIGLPRIADELYNTARVLRVFVSGTHKPIE